MLSTVYSGTSFVLKAGGWQMSEMDSIRLWATEDHHSVGTVGLRQGLYDTDRGQSNLHSSLSIDWHYKARPRQYSTDADDDSMWELVAVQALQLGTREEPSTFDYIWNAGDRSLDTTNLTKYIMMLKEGVEPYCQPPRTEPPYKRERILSAVRKGLEACIYEPSQSPWGAPVVLVSRPGNEADDRLCADYREPNNRTVIPPYPLPRIQQALDALQGKAYFSLFDFPAAYYQVEVEERFESCCGVPETGRPPPAYKNAFWCGWGLWQPSKEWLITSSLA
ncbi:hypothetical protein Efla_007024 [Eimeria flavescens]